MAELELTIMSRGTGDAENLEPLLKAFEARHRADVRLRVLGWNSAWPEMMRAARRRAGPDVSEIGTSWLGTLLSMDALSPLSPEETLDLGGPAAFIPSTWQSALPPSLPVGYGQTWAIPLWADTRLLYYRRDLLAKAGDARTAGGGEEAAFASHGRMVETLERLADSGVPVPLALPTHRSHMTIHNAASWIWGAGGRFLTESGREVCLDEPATLAGIRDYFGLGRYLVDTARGLNDAGSDALYWQGQAAVTISGPWLLALAISEVVESTGVVFPPGVPFVGGSHLVCWKHTRERRLAVKLIQYLASAQVQAARAAQAGLLPTRFDVLAKPPFADRPIYWLAARGLQRGRSFPQVPLWGLVEEQLNEALGDIWAEILAQPDPSLERTIAARTKPLVRQLSATLGSRGCGGQGTKAEQTRMNDHEIRSF